MYHQICIHLESQILYSSVKYNVKLALILSPKESWGDVRNPDIDSMMTT